MIESNEELLAKLEQATGPVLNNAASDEPLDDETAKLRESWEVLSGLLNAADDDAPTLKQSSADVGSSKTVVRFLAALAAMLLVAFAAWAVLSQATDSGDVPNSSGGSIAESEVEPKVEEVASASDSTSGEIATSEPVDEFAWEDSFDEQLAATSQAFRSVQSDWSGGDRHYSVLIDQFEQFSDELSKGSL